MAKYSSANGAEVTEFADPPLLVVSVKNSWLMMAPVSESIENADTYPGIVVVLDRVAAYMYFGDPVEVTENMTSSAQ